MHSFAASARDRHGNTSIRVEKPNMDGQLSWSEHSSSPDLPCARQLSGAANVPPEIRKVMSNIIAAIEQSQ